MSRGQSAFLLASCFFFMNNSTLLTPLRVSTYGSSLDGLNAGRRSLSLDFSVHASRRAKHEKTFSEFDLFCGREHQSTSINKKARKGIPWLTNLRKKGKEIKKPEI